MLPYVNIHTHRPTGSGIELRTEGVHPWDADMRLVATLGERLSDAQAVGETGLDFVHGPSREMQTEALRAQLRLARERGLPVVLHCVRAFEPLMRELAACEPRAVIFHGFIGSPEQARRALAKGYFLSFGERAFASPKTLAALRETPLSQLFLETDDSPVLVVGLGGVGAYAAEMIARAGVGRMTVADADTVNATNINRQLVALHSTVGRPKSEVLAERLRDINPEIALTVVNKYIKDEETYTLLDAARYDYVVDAIDTLSPKLALIAAALERGLPLVSSMGAGAKTDPTKLEIADISKTHHCPLAHMLRKRLHKIGIRRGFRAVFSPEPMREGAMILCEEQNKKSNVGTISYIPALFGIGCASVVVRDLIGELEG